MPEFIELIPDYLVLRDHGLRIMRDEVSGMVREPKEVRLSDVQGLLAGINIALNSVHLTAECQPILDALREALDKMFPVVQVLNEEEWESDNDYYAYEGE